jgi:hypothetical protein
MDLHVIYSAAGVSFTNCTANPSIYSLSRLTGTSLFPGMNFHDVLKLNKACEIDYSSPLLISIPKSALNLL